MAHRFVELRDGQRNVHWQKLGMAYGLIFVITAATFEACWYGAAGRWSYELLLITAIASTVAMIRSALRAMSIPEVELGEDASVVSQVTAH